MEISEDPEKIKEWVPLMMEGRQSEEPIAITYDETGTDELRRINEEIN